MKTNYEDFMDYELPEKEITSKCCELALNSWKYWVARMAAEWMYGLMPTVFLIL